MGTLIANDAGNGAHYGSGQCCSWSNVIGVRTFHVIQRNKASPSVFAYCKQSKTGRQEGLGTRLDLLYLVGSLVLVPYPEKVGSW